MSLLLRAKQVARSAHVREAGKQSPPLKEWSEGTLQRHGFEEGPQSAAAKSDGAGLEPSSVGSSPELQPKVHSQVASHTPRYPGPMALG